MSAALAPSAIAFADITGIGSDTLDPIGKETLTGLYTMKATPPAVDSSLQGYQEFHLLDGNDNNLGTFYAYEATSQYLAPLTGGLSDQSGTQVLYVDSGVASLLGDSPTGSVLPDGTIISNSSGLGGAYELTYVAIPGADGAPDTITETLKTAFGTINIPTSFDAADLSPVLPDGITGIDTPVITSISGLPPLDVAVQGVQSFNDDGAGTFTAVETTTRDGFGFSSQALLVTADTAGTAGTGAGDVPPVGSVFNTLALGHWENVYTSLASPTPGGQDVITDTLINTKTGKTINLDSLFAGNDASAGLGDGSNFQPVTLSSGDIVQADPNSPEVFTGINGLPPGDASIQGTQLFDILHGTDQVGTFNADVTTVPTMEYSNYAETFLVTDSTDPTLVPDGSVFDVASYGNGWENVYTDLPGLGHAGHNLITDTLVTPLGHLDLSWLYQGLDASAGLTHADGFVNLLDAAWLDLLHLF